MPGPRCVELRPTEDPQTILATVDMGAVAEIAAPDGWAAVGATPTAPSPTSTSATRTPSSASTTSPPSTCSTLGRQVPDVNLEIVEPGPEPDAITMRVHERGAGITEACGTGAARGRVGRRPLGVRRAGPRNSSCTWTAAAREWRSTDPSRAASR